jgi:hypothetical protein
MLGHILNAAKPLIEIVRFMSASVKKLKEEVLVGLRIWAKKCHWRFGDYSNDA